MMPGTGYTPPAFNHYVWDNTPLTDTPLDATHLEAAEDNIGSYVDTVIADYDNHAGGVFAQLSNNLSDLPNNDTARHNLRVPMLRECKAVATANVATLSGLITVDGYTLQPNDRVLVVNQSTGSQNGPWVAAAGAWTRPSDYPTGGVLTSRIVPVCGGNTQKGSLWQISSTASITIDTTATTWIQAGGGVASFNGRTGAVVPTTGDYTAAQVTNAADKSAAGAQTFTGEVQAPDLEALGLSGAGLATRIVGATSSGPPTTGTFNTRDVVVDASGALWVCTAGGTPGSWRSIAGGSILVARAYRNAAWTIPTSNTWVAVPVDTKSFDTANGFDVVTNHQFVAPVAGYYLVSGSIDVANGTASADLNIAAGILKNGAINSIGSDSGISSTSSDTRQSVSDVIFCNAGDTLQLAVSSSGAWPVTTGSSNTYLSVTLAASLPGTVGTTTVARAYRTATLAIAGTTNTKIPLDTISYDPGNNISTANGRYNVPATGYYQVNAEVGTFGLASGTRIITMIYKNGSEVARAEGEVSGSSQGVSPAVSDVVFCNVGDYLELWVYLSVPGNVGGAGTVSNYLSVVQVGNSMNFTVAGGDLAGSYPNPHTAIAKDWLQNGVVGSGDLAVSGLSINGATGAITFTVAAGVAWVMDTTGVLRRVVLASSQTLTLPLDILPASGGWQINGLFLHTDGTLSYQKIAGQTGATGNITPTTSTVAGALKILDVSSANVGGTYEFGNGSTTATQGTNWLDRRPWARGAYGVLSNGADQSTTSTTMVAVAGMLARFELTGVPVRLSWYLDRTSNGTAGATYGFMQDNANLYVPHATRPVATSLIMEAFGTVQYEYTPTAGSHTLAAAFANAATAAYVGAGSIMTVEEILRPNANNGTS